MNALWQSCAALALVLFVTACGDSKPVSPMVLGKRLYFTNGCSACHMSRGEGGPMAPPLRNLAQHWKREDLARHMTEPDAILKTDERLQQLSRRYPTPMKGVPAPEEDRLLIADWLLSLQ